jgi:hypothetical protein
MPQPIVPIHRQEYMPILFGESELPEFQVSELQSILLQQHAYAQNNKRIAVNFVKALEQIDKNTDFVVTAVTNSNERYCSVPNNIDDNKLLALKAEGLISGYGRSVKITERGRTALRDAYLGKKNVLRENRNSDKFDYNSFSRIASETKGE